MKKLNRTVLTLIIFFGTLSFGSVTETSAQMGRAIRFRAPTVSTRNFVVTAPTEAFANKVANEAERYRKELSQEWLGYEIKPWHEKCPIVVKIEAHAGGVTRFGFERGRSQPVGWEMEIFGPPDRILDSVLPHEVTHTIFASHFGRPLPRWADEGACTTVEHQSEKNKNHRMLMRFLSTRPSRGIPFNRMFSMREYPDDILPLYAQGYSLAKFLIQQKGKREFIRYVETGLRYEDRGEGLNGWGRATKEIYGFGDLSDLQIQWLSWVKKGSPNLNAIARTTETTNAPNAVQPVRFQSSNDRQRMVSVNPASNLQRQTTSVDDTKLAGNWYVKQSQGDMQSVSTEPYPESPGFSNPVQTASFVENQPTGQSDLSRRSVQSGTSGVSGYRPGSIATAKPFKMVADSAFVRPRQELLSGNVGKFGAMPQHADPATRQMSETPENQTRGRPTIYR